MVKRNEPELSKIGRVTSISVFKGTNKNWDEWIRLLKKEGAERFTRKQVVVLLKQKYKLSPWWQQIVAHGFEVHLGKRVDGQNAKGEYSTTATKSLSVSEKTAWKFLTSSEGLAMWLQPMSEFVLKPKQPFEIAGGIFGEVRTMLINRRLRLSWQDMEWNKITYVHLLIVPRPNQKCILAFQHEGLQTARQKTQMHQHWRKILEEVSFHFEN